MASLRDRLGGPIGERDPAVLLRAFFRLHHYRALLASFRRYPAPLDSLSRYLAGRGAYPHRCRIRTPAGEVAPFLLGPHDMLTVNEVFCRRIYPLEAEAAVIVDIGANIGISALYFLTEAPRAHVYAFEPNPALTDRLRTNLIGFERRTTVDQHAIATWEGKAELGVEPTGRYGGIGVAGSSGTVEVSCRAAAAVLDEILELRGRINLLKIDIEGMEIDVLRSLRPRTLGRIDSIHMETEYPANPFPELFSFRRAGLISSLVARR